MYLLLKPTRCLDLFSGRDLDLEVTCRLRSRDHTICYIRFPPSTLTRRRY